jgi:hypothetical protein
MYTLKLLAPLIVASCLEGVTTGQGDVCVLREPTPVVKYYEPGKSCYVNGTFYSQCEQRHD